ncbi:MAG: N-acetyltransferase [Amphiplicatus sp.]
MIVRAAAQDDYPAIRACIDNAFGQPHEGALVEALRASSDAVIELVAESDGRIAGVILLSKLTAPENSLALAPVAVAPDMQGQGVGGALIRAAIKEAHESGAAAIFLLGEPGYYSRFSFSVEAAGRFETAYPKEYMMALELTPGALAGLSGKIAYASPFNNL